MMKLGKIGVDLDIGPALADDCNGLVPKKSLFVFHETVSPDYAGMADIKGVSNYLDVTGYGIHSIIDMEGYLAWASGKRKCIFYHTASGAGGVNSRSIGLELISNVMLRSPDNAVRRAIWAARKVQLRESAKLLAWCSRVEGFPLVYSDGTKPGVTTHWQVTKTYGIYGGHVDCWPVHQGGYFPILNVIYMARGYQKVGY